MTGYGGTQLANAHRTVRKNTIQIAVDIPEDKYDFVAAPGSRSVRAMLAHIAHATKISEDMHRTKRLTSLKGYDFPSMMASNVAGEQTPRTKAELIELLRSEGERYATWLESLSPEFLAETYTDPAGENARTRLEGLLSPKEHEMHHRGQLMLIQRMLGVVPHLTRLFQERMAARH